MVVDDVLKFGASEGICFVQVLIDGCWVLMNTILGVDDVLKFGASEGICL